MIENMGITYLQSDTWVSDNTRFKLCPLLTLILHVIVVFVNHLIEAYE